MTVRASFVAASLACSVACGDAPAPAASTGPAADLIIVNGKVHTMDAAATIAQAVAVSGTTILKVGTTDEIKALAGPTTRVIDAQGHAVTPGFNDSHVHFVSGGLSLGDVDLAGLTTLAQVQDKIRAFAATKPANAWVKGRGWLYAPLTNASPTRAQLDAVVSDHPAVMTCYDGWPSTTPPARPAT